MDKKKVWGLIGAIARTIGWLILCYYFFSTFSDESNSADLFELGVVIVLLGLGTNRRS